MEGTWSAAYSTGRLAAASGYSAQQIRDLEGLEVIPAAHRGANGYRTFGSTHLTALQAYRDLATAVGPVAARATMAEARQLPRSEAVARIVGLHVGLARDRERVLDALRALERIPTEDFPSDDAADSMGISSLASALGVRASTLRFWESEGLLAPERATRMDTRIYPATAIRDARVIAALRSGGYGLPAIREVMTSLRTLGHPAEARDALHARLDDIATRSEALLRAGSALVDLINDDVRATAQNPTRATARQRLRATARQRLRATARPQR